MPDDIVKLSPAALDRILVAVLGEQHLCPACGGAGTATEWVRAVDGRYVPLFGVVCYACPPMQRGFVRVVEGD